MKPKIAIVSASGCRACETTMLDIHYGVNALTRWAEIRFWPYVLGSTTADLEKIDRLDVCFFSGAIATGADRALAEMMRKKCGRLVAVGACAAYGGMPGLKNLRKPSDAGTPVDADLPEGLTLPKQEKTVRALDGAHAVVPGCPAPVNLVWAAVSAMVCGGEADARITYTASRLPEEMVRPILSGLGPPTGAVFAGEKAVCASCSRKKEEKRFKAVKRPYHGYESTGRCLLEQGLICQGIATREGCGGLCTGVGVPCRGCYGKPPATYDPGAKMVSAISSTFETEKPDEIRKIANDFVDMTGCFYRYTLYSQCMLLSEGSNKPQDTNHEEPTL